MPFALGFSGLVLAAGPAAVAGQEPPHRLPGVGADRVVLEARVVDGRGRPVRGLSPADFRLEVDGRPVAVETALWVDDAAAGGGADPPPRPREVGSAVSEGRLLVLLFQKDAASGRLRGLVRSLGQAKELLDTLTPRDRVALLTFDSHLRLHLDFTGDLPAVRAAIDESVLLRWPAPIPPGPEPSLADHLDPWEALEASSPEQALLALGRALRPLRGTKTVVLFGWGLGRLSAGGFSLDADYGRARDALDRARAAVYCLDVTDADWHSLELGLRQVAEDTGGQYYKVHENAGAALARVAAALAGHYVLSFEPPPGPRGEHRVRLALEGRRGTVLTRHRYVD